MNKTLYRAKLVSVDKWVYGYYYATPMTFNESVEISHCIVDKKGRIYKVDPNTVCQSTGFRDKNKTLIYERDLVEAKVSCHVCEVVYHKGSYCIVHDHYSIFSEPRVKTSTYNQVLGFLYVDKDVEVVGNSIDTPLTKQ